MRVYHGTTDRHAESIEDGGLRACSCVALDEGLAWYYAGAAVDEEGGEEMVLVTDVPEDWLVADEQALGEPVGYGTRIGRDLEEILDERGRTRVTSLSICASARVDRLVAGWSRV